MHTAFHSIRWATIHSFLFIVLLLLVVSLPLVSINTFRNPHYLSQANAEAYNPGQEGAGGVCVEGSCGCTTGINCTTGKLNESAPPALGTGYTIPGTNIHQQVVGYYTDNNNVVHVILAPFQNNPNEGGSSDHTNQPTPHATLTPTIPITPNLTITPTVTPPIAGNATIHAWALLSDPSHLQTCDQLVRLKSCLDNPAGVECDTTSTKQYLKGTSFYLGAWGPSIQTDETGATFIDIQSGVWALTAVPPSGNYSNYLTCVNTTTYPAYEPYSQVYVAENATANFLVGMGQAVPWLQIKGGGNTYGDLVLSYMPIWNTPKPLFDNTASPLNPGIVSSSTGVDFSDSSAHGGTSNISTTNWNTNNALTTKDWYQFFSSRLQQAAISSYTGSGGKPAMLPNSSFTAYITKDWMGGNLTINTPWVIGNQEKLIVIVDGTLDIRSTITITGGGFIAFIVKDDILVNSSVGTTAGSETPVVEGMYIAGGTLRTGTTTAAATARFVGKGMFAANEIIAERDLYPILGNNSTSADLFLYNPSFLVTMPDILKDFSYTWQEVAP